MGQSINYTNSQYRIGMIYRGLLGLDNTYSIEKLDSDCDTGGNTFLCCY